MLGLGDLSGVNPTVELLQPVNFEDQVQQLISRYQLQMVVLTCGAFGSYVVTDSEMSFQPTPKVRVADTVGAGDSFTGAFCAAILAGKPIPEAHKNRRRCLGLRLHAARRHAPYPQALKERIKVFSTSNPAALSAAPVAVKANTQPIQYATSKQAASDNAGLPASFALTGRVFKIP